MEAANITEQNPQVEVSIAEETLPSSSGSASGQSKGPSTTGRGRRNKKRQVEKSVSSTTSASAASATQVERQKAFYANFDIAPEDLFDDPKLSAPDASTSLPGIPGFARIGESNSLPTNTVYIQQTSGFKKAQRQQLEKALAEQKRLEALNAASDKLDDNLGSGGIEAGLLMQGAFRVVSLVLQGIVAGFCLFHSIAVVAFLSPELGSIDFLNHYAILAMPLHVAFYVSFTLCCVSVLDRYDVSQNVGRFFWRSITGQSAGFCIAFYILALVLGLVSLPVEERMEFYHRNATSLASSLTGQLVPGQAWTSGDLIIWKSCAIARAVAAILGFILICTKPSTDLLSKHLKKTDEKFRQMMNSVETVHHGDIQASP